MTDEAPWGSGGYVAGCLTEHDVLALVDDHFSREARAAVGSHLEDCDACFVLVAEAYRATRHEPGSRPSPVPDERYEILGEIGRGGVGIVYRAHDRRLDRLVAIKVLTETVGADDVDVSRRLLVESKAMARLQHPNVVAVFDVVSREGHTFIVMEHVRGQTLRQWLARERRTTEVIISMFVTVGQGLQAAHDAGIIHRDFKPDNVLVDDKGRPQITDFGLARAGPRVDEDLVRVTSSDANLGGAHLHITTGGIAGTPAYMPPEQLDGRTVDARADVFAFCVSLWEGLFGQRPFPESTAVERFAAARAGQLLSPGSRFVPPPVLDTLRRGLSPNPDARPSSMHLIVDGLQPTVPSARRRWPRVAAVGTGVIVAAVVLAVGRARDEPAAAQCSDSLVTPPLMTAEQWETFEGVADDVDSTESRLVANRVRQELDARVEALDREYASACRAGSEGARSAAETEHTQHCLRALWWDLSARADLARQGRSEAFEEIWTLRPATDCAAHGAELASAGVSTAYDPDVAEELTRLRAERMVGVEGLESRARSLVERAERRQVRRLESQARFELAMTLHASDTERAREQFDRAAELANAEHDALMVGMTRIMKGLMLQGVTEQEILEAELEQTRAYAAKIRDPVVRGDLDGLINVHEAYLHIRQGRTEEARTANERARKIASERSPRLLSVTLNIAVALSQDLESMRRNRRQLVAFHESQGRASSTVLMNAILSLARVELALLDIDEADALVSRVAGMARPGALHPTTRVELELLRAAVDLERGKAKQALTRLDDLLLRFEPDSERHREGAAERARVLIALGRAEEAAAVLEELAQRSGTRKPANIADALPLATLLARALHLCGRDDEAYRLVAPINAWHQSNGGDDASLAAAVTGWAALGRGLDAEAERWLAKAVESADDPRVVAWASFGAVVLEARLAGAKQPDHDQRVREALEAMQPASVFPYERAEMERFTAR